MARNSKAGLQGTRKKLGQFLSRLPGRTERRKRVPVRGLHLGIDYGTSRSKLVLTDYGAAGGERSFVVRPPSDLGGDGGYLIPSTVTVANESIKFGYLAEANSNGATAYRSLKMLCAYPKQYFGDDVPLPPGLNARDLATLYVGHLVQLGQQSARRYASRFRAEPQFSMTMGAPMAQLDKPDLHAMFVEVARVAHRLTERLDLLHGVSARNARRVLADVRKELAGSETAEPRAWVRSEAEAALFWAHKSPDIDDGRYACVDVGAGTTSASWFHIVARRRGGVMLREQLSFYGAACNPPACDAIDAALAEQTLDIATVADVREQETQLIETLSSEQMISVNDVLTEITSVFGSASGEAFHKEKSLIAWRNSRAQIFFLGGGSKIEAVRNKLIALKVDWLSSDPEAEPGIPLDLTEEDGSELREDPTFLLVAYGLARRLGDVPDTFSPSQVEAFRRSYSTRERESSENLYSD